MSWVVTCVVPDDNNGAKARAWWLTSRGTITARAAQARTFEHEATARELAACMARRASWRGHASEWRAARLPTTGEQQP